MKYKNLGSYKTIRDYVNDKLERLSQIDVSFDALFGMMFEDKKNIFFEESRGYRIKRITYGESKNNVDIIAKNIKRKYPGAEYNSVMGLYLDNSHIWIETFWAILKCGFKPLLLNMRLDDDSLEYALDVTNAIGVISNGKIFSVPTLTIDELYSPNEIEVNGPFGEELFVMSSGTSNNIKICAYSAKEIINILAQSREIITSSKLVQRHYNGELKLLALLPFYHIFGFVAVYLWFAFYARTFVKLNDLNPTTIQNAIRRHHVTHIFAVPLFWQKTYDSVIKEVKNRGEKTYRKLLKGILLSQKPIIGKLITKFAFKEVRDNLFGESISYLISGGSMIDKNVLSFFNAIGYHISNGYGMSEIGITSVELSNKSSILNSASIGNPLSGIRYQINENNELSVKGATVAKYIINDGKVIKNEGEWFLTHDLVKEENGRFYILGREDDLVVSITGENLNPNIIEEKLKVDDVLNLCLINGKDGGLPVLLVSINKYLPAELTNKLIKDLVMKISENNLNSQIGKVVLVAEPFIKGEEFKMNRKALENRYYANELAIYNPQPISKDDNDEIMEFVKEVFANVLNKDEKDIFAESDFFLDEGGTSLDYYVMVGKIQDEYGINITSSSNPLNTVKDISNYIKDNL